MSFGDDSFKAVFDKTYPLMVDGEPLRMPFQGAWPIDFWQLENTAFMENPHLWWPGEPECAFEGCHGEAALSCNGVYLCRNHR